MGTVRFALWILLSLVCLTAASYGAHLEWVQSLDEGIVDTSPVIADVDEKGDLEIVMCSTDGDVLLWNAGGQRLWNRKVGELVSVPPAVADLDGKRGLEICVLTNDGKVVCLNSKGDILWQYQMPQAIQWGCTTVVIRDIDKDGSPEVMAADSAGHLVCLDRRGKPKWQYDCPSPVNAPLTVANLDGKGTDEIVFGADDGCARCLSAEGKVVWSYQTGGGRCNGSIIADIDGQPGLEVFVGTQKGTLVAISSTGTLLWSFEAGSEIDSCISVGDMDADGHEDIVAGNLRGYLFRLTHTGQEKWRYDVNMRSRRPAALADLDGDGNIEVLLGNYSGYLYVFTEKGELRERTELTGVMNATPAVADIDGDGVLEAVCPMTSGEVRCYSWYSTALHPYPRVLWTMYRYDAAQTGSPSNTPVSNTVTAQADYGRLLVGTNEFRLDVSNPRGETLRIEQTVAVRGTDATTRAVTETADRSGTASLAYDIDGRGACDVQFSYVILNKDAGREILKGSRSFYVVPFANDLALIRTGIANLNPPDKLDPAVADYFVGQRDSLEHRLGEIEERVSHVSTLSDGELAALKQIVSRTVGDLERLSYLLIAAARQCEKGKSRIAIWTPNPWAPFEGISDLPAAIPDVARFDLDVYQGEYESAAFNVANLSPEPVPVRIHMEKMKRSSAPNDEKSSLNPYDFFSLHEVAAVPTVNGTYSADALPRLNQGRLVTLPPWSARQVWLTFSARDLPPDTYRTSLVLKSLELEPVTVQGDLAVRVRSVALPKPSPLKLCNWGYVYSSVIGDYEEEACDDLVSHGTNVFVITSYHTPAAQFDSSGNLVGTMDYTNHDFIVNLYKDHGMFLFYSFRSALKGRDGDAYMSPAWKKAYATWLNQWVSHLRGCGVGYDKFALYPVDEPGLHNTGRTLIDQFIEISKLTRETDPRIQIYTDPVAGARLEHLKEMAPYVDIWCPNRGAIVLARNDPRLDYLLSTGKPVWTYECEGSAKEQPPLVYYRGQAWLAWQRGLKGIGFWSYCTSSYDPWFRPVGERANDYLLIYQGDGIVTSKRWEACRDGVEDYGALWLLNHLVEEGQRKGVDATLLAKSRERIKTATAEVASWSERAHGKEYRKDPRSVAGHDWEVLERYRRQIADLSEQTQKELSSK
jgi:outer membrane protein assembly factor BamB